MKIYSLKVERRPCARLSLTSKLVVCGTAMLLHISPIFAQGGDEMLVPPEPASFAKTVLDQREALNANSEIVLSLEEWRFEGKEGDERIAALQKLLKPQAKIKLSQDPENEASKLAGGVRSELGDTSSVTWHIRSLNSMKRFHSLYDDKTIARLKKEGIKANTEREWLFTDQTLYKWFPLQQGLWVEPLDPFTMSYPIRYDILSFPLSVKGNVADFLKTFEIKARESGGFDAGFGKDAAIELFVSLLSNGSPAVTFMKFTPPGADQYFERYYSSFQSAPNLGEFPLSIVQIQKTSNITEISMFTFKKLEFGKMTPKEMALEIPKGATITDEQVPFPVKE